MQLQLKRAASLGIAWLGFFCSTAWAYPSIESISPAQPEAYQPFTITILYLEEAPGGHLPGILGVGVEGGTITLDGYFPSTFFMGLIQRKSVIVSGLPRGVYGINAREAGSSNPATILGDLTVSPAPPAQPVYALYHPDINHYFLTASTAQRDFLVQNPSLGWGVVDEGFKAWPANGPAPVAAKPVCRLYSPLVNTHFFSADAASCDSLKQQTSTWIDEGIAFRALVPTAGTCPHGTLPVWRLYNNRFAQLDSNHRYVVSQDTYRHMIANGWIGEGVAFCSPE